MPPTGACTAIDGLYEGDGTSCDPQPCFLFTDGFESGDMSAWSASVGAV